MMRNVVTCRERGDEDMAEWHKEIGDEFFKHTDFHENEAAKASNELHEIVDSSETLMYSWRV